MKNKKDIEKLNSLMKRFMGSEDEKEIFELAEQILNIEIPRSSIRMVELMSMKKNYNMTKEKTK
jgi:hypothetical protein